MAVNTFFKAVSPDGTDFHTGKVQWAPPEDHDGEWVVTHPGGVVPSVDESASMDAVLCVSSEPGDCTGFSWPCRLLEVEPVDGSGFHHLHENKWRGTQFRVVDELPAWQSFGPNGEQVVAFLKVIKDSTPRQLQAAQDAEWDAAGEAALNAARVAATRATEETSRHAARIAAWGVAWRAAWRASCDAALAYVASDLIPKEQFEILTKPFREAGVPLP